MAYGNDWEYGSTEDPFQKQMVQQQQGPVYQTQPVNGVKSPEQPIQYGEPAQPTPAAPTAPVGTSATGPATGDPTAFIRQWQQTHPASEGIGPLADALAAAGFQVPRYMYGSTASNNELVVNGQKFKVLGAEDSPNTAYWYTGGDDSAPGNFGGGGGLSPALQPYGGGTPFQQGPALFGAGSFGTNGESSGLYDMLMSRARQSLDVSPNDPLIRNASDAHSAQLERAERNYEAGLAEKAGPLANIGVERRIGAEKVGQGAADFESQLMLQERAARRQEIQQALQGAQGLLTTQQQLALQEELQRLSLGQQDSQFGRSLAQNESQFGRNLAQNAYQFDVNDAYRYSPFAGS